MNIKELVSRFDKIEEEVDQIDIDVLEEKVYQLEEDVNEWLGVVTDEHEEVLQKLSKRIARFKRDNDFYDAEAELDRMFPDRYDNDFDEESMLYNSLFGKG